MKRHFREDQAVPISAVCTCGAEIEATDDVAGQSVNCPQCAAEVYIPLAGTWSKVARRAKNYRANAQVPTGLMEKALAGLGPNEELVWLGQPEDTLVFRRSLGYLVGGGMVAVISLMWLTGMFSQKDVTHSSTAVRPAARQRAQTPPPAKHTDTLPAILLIGSTCVALVPLFRWRSAKGTCYALTNRRALVYKEGLFGPTRESYSPVEVAQMRRCDAWVFEEGGDLIFRTVQVLTTSFNQRTGSHRSVKTTHYGFLAIADVKEVERLVRETLIDRFVDKLTAASAL
jgi:hypothetical protein